MVTGTGSVRRAGSRFPTASWSRRSRTPSPGTRRAVAATVAGGVFLDQAVLREEQVTGQVAVDAMLSATGPDGERMLADAFQGFAVSFARYCWESASMAQIADPRRIAGLPRPADRRGDRRGGLLVAVAVVVSVGDPGRFAWVRTFFVIFGSLLIQALPFVMLGALAALVEVFVPIGTFEKLGALPGRCSSPPRRWPASRSRSASAVRCRSRDG